MLFCDWPAEILDLNPIENLWHIVKCSIARLPVAKSMGALEKWVQEEWNTVPF